MGVKRRVAAAVSILAYVSVAVVAVWELSTTRWDLVAQGRALSAGRVNPQSVVLVAHLVCLVSWTVIAWRAAGHVRAGFSRRPSQCGHLDRDQPSGVSGMLAIACAGIMPSLSSSAPLAPSALPVATLLLPSVAVVEVRRSRPRSPESVDIASPAVGSAGRNAIMTVRVFGHPHVEGPGGRRVVFRKSRALELLVWLCLNRDRQRRSTARTAIWEVDIGDASFATVVSEMRRALAEADSGSDPQSWCPASYTDEMALSGRVVSDAELMADCLERFRRDPASHADELASLVSGIRDIPFAGAGYLWPDVDGTTTRLMILGLDAVTELADWAASVGDAATALSAIAAGLRMMPGDADLLERQRGLLSRRSVVAPRQHRHRRRGGHTAPAA